MGLRSWLGLLTAVVGALLMSAGASADAAFPGGNGKIAFVRYLEGGSHIFVMNADGSGVTRLTESPGYDFAPAWSPDGAKIAFTRVDAVSSPGVQGQYDIAVINADGSGLTKLTDDEGIDQQPAWSPDGRQIAFSSYREGVENFEIFVMASDGSGLRQLTNAGDGYVSQAPSWSPDGRTIVFERGGQTIPSDICVMRADGSGQTNLTATPDFEMAPDWSPDASRIVFTWQRDIGATIYSMDSTGGGVRQLIQPAGGEGYPAWSPDGTKIAFVARGSGGAAIWVMNRDGTGRTMLVDGDESPVWQPLPQTDASTSPLGSNTPAPSFPGSAQDCVPAFSQSTAPSPAPTAPPDTLPVGGGPPAAGDPATSYQALSLLFAGLLLLAIGLVALRARTRP